MLQGDGHCSPASPFVSDVSLARNSLFSLSLSLSLSRAVAGTGFSQNPIGEKLIMRLWPK